MIPRPSLFPALFAGQPDLVRHFLESALQLRELRELYTEARQRVDGHKELSQAILEILDVRMQVSERDLQTIPKTGPVLVVANHPFGILDGMLLDSLLLQVRPDVKILTNSMLAEIEELRDRILPVDLFGEAKHNVRTLRSVMELLRAGHGAAFFPAGEVSHFHAKQKRVMDGEWSTAVVRCARAMQAPVVPVYFKGGNSWSFQVAGLIHPRLRTARLAGELMNKRGRQVEVRVGTPVGVNELKRFSSLEEASLYLRARTYYLGYRSTGSERGKLPALPLKPRVQPIAPAASSELLAEEVQRLAPLVETSEFSVVVAKADQIPQALQEVGRLREVTFRAAGEGTGKARDLDRFDRTYQHLLLWNKRDAAIAGGYRLGWTADLGCTERPYNLYTSSLFRFGREFFRRLGPALELGRSFIRVDYQRDYAPLLLLWQAIGRLVASRPEAPVLFGPVSISAGYSEAARELIVRFVTEHSFRNDLSAYVQPRHPFRSRMTSSVDLQVISRYLDDVEQLGAPLQDVSGQEGVPVLLRQYLRLGGQVVGFNVDSKFANALDGLLVVDLRNTAPKLLGRYMGQERAAEFLQKVARVNITAA